MVKFSDISRKFNPNDEKNLIKFYDENNDEEKYIPVDKDLLNFLNSNNIYLKQKLGQGGDNAAFETTTGNVILIPGLYNIEKYNNIQTDQEKYNLLAQSTIKIIDIITYKDRFLPLLEKLDYTISEYLYNHRNDIIKQKVEFYFKLRNDYNSAKYNLDKSNYIYTDTLFDNMGYIGNRFVFIDLDSLHPKEDFTFGKLPLDDFFSIIEYDELILKTGYWKLYRGFFHSAEEIEKVKQLIKKDKRYQGEPLEDDF